jgi:hypothetical protein
MFHPEPLAPGPVQKALGHDTEFVWLFFNYTLRVKDLGGLSQLNYCIHMG